MGQRIGPNQRTKRPIEIDVGNVDDGLQPKRWCSAARSGAAYGSGNILIIFLGKYRSFFQTDFGDFGACGGAPVPVAVGGTLPFVPSESSGQLDSRATNYDGVSDF